MRQDNKTGRTYRKELKRSGIILCGCLLIVATGLFISCDFGPKGNFNYPYDKYKGMTAQQGDSPCLETSDEISISSPEKNLVTADAFFTLEGSVNSPLDKNIRALVTVSKVNEWKNTTYLLDGDFRKDIWLRFGPGEYVVMISKVRLEADLNGEGFIKTYQYLSWRDYEFTVTNVRDENGCYFYPSDEIQSDDPEIAAIALELTGEITLLKPAISKIHDYVVTKLFYDLDSLEEGKRKKQDASSVLKNGMAVCEGYATFFNALLRSVGIPAAFVYGPVSSGAWHAWSYVQYGDEWKYIDVTWDDPLVNGHNDYPNGANLQHSWFMLDKLSQHTVYEISTDKRITPSLPPADNRNMGLAFPDSWEYLKKAQSHVEDEESEIRRAFF